jgi:ABC-type spermidine/putrescine transport system permease subunit II
MIVRVSKSVRWAEVSALTLFLAFIVGPLLNIGMVSFINRAEENGIHRGALTLKWYRTALSDEQLRSATSNSLIIAVVVGCLSATTGFISSLAWWSPRQRTVVLISQFACALLPSEAHALGLSDLLAVVGLPRSGFLPIVLAHLTWTLPFATVINMIGMSYVGQSVVEAGCELSGRVRVIAKIILPLVAPSMVSAFLVGSLLSFNESTRGYFLSSAQRTVGEFARGKMRSGMDPSAQAMATIDVLLALLVTTAVFGCTYLTKRRAKSIA